jgi:titin
MAPSLSLSGTNDVVVRWSAPGDNGGAAITGYAIERQVAGSWSAVAQVSGSVLSYTATRAALGQLNVFRVTAQNSIGSGPASAAGSLLTPYATASAPQNFVASVNQTTGRVDISYGAPSYLGGGAVQGYQIQTSKDGGATWIAVATTTGLTISVSAPGKGQTLAYRVVATTQAGASLSSATVNISIAATVPGAVVAPVAALTGTADVTLRWYAPSDNGGLNLTGYLVERQVNGAWITAAQLAATTLTYTAPRALPGVQNVFRITASNTLGSGPASPIVSVMTPYAQASAPQNFTAVYNANTKRVDIAFGAPTYLGGSAVNFYSVQSSVDGNNWTSIVNLTPSTLASSIAAPAKGASLSYRVTAVTQFGYGAPSNVVAVSVALTVPSAPNLSSITYTQDGSVNLAWIAPENGGTAITGYKLQKLDANNNWVDAVTVSGSTLSTVVARDLPGSKVSWRVIAINSVGASAASTVASYTIPAVRSAAVQSVAVTSANTSGSVQVSFAEPASLGGSALISYQIQVSRDGGQTWSLATTTKLLTVAVGAPAKGVTWVYRVVANTAVGLGDVSTAVSYTGK